ncbi:ATP-binding protein [Lentzea sp. NPDC051838]|uniref:ATP-binding protein n=1 Tax=Lentzea sp. NPDC051838 TaxID=3154849 RepID=UPI003445A982
MRLEGPNPADGTDETDFLGCDLTEYHGGSTFTDAHRIVVSQLKYSVKHASKAWTAARLAEGKGAKKVSVAKRLAEMFTGVCKNIGLDAALQKTTIALVSNQPVDRALADMLADAKSSLESRPTGYPTALLLRGLDARHHEDLNKLLKATGLRSKEFTTFLRMLDLSGCGEESRSLQRLNLSTGIGDVLVGDAKAAGDGLMELMRAQMLPETADDPGLSRANIIVALGASGERALFPYPLRLKSPESRVQTRQAHLLAQELQGESTKLLAHGPPGVGKTTVVTALQQELPAGSAVVVFDCYADGEYLSPREDRHTTRALVHVANEVALQLGLVPTVVADTPLDEGVMWRRFEHVIDQAGLALPPDALLVIVIDAADNSAEAARRVGSTSVFRELWRVKVPDNVRLLMTARSPRRSDVVDEADHSVRQVSIEPFDLKASSDLLRLTYPDATDEQCDVFHQHSRGIARVQAYATATATSVVQDAIELVGVGLNGIFDEVLSTALSSVSGTERQRQIATLSTMSRPANPTTLAQVLEVSEARIAELVEDLAPALRFGHDGVGFADEDFENHLAATVTEVERRAMHSAFADYFLRNYLTNEESALLVAEHLFNACRADELIALATDASTTAAISDGLLRSQAHRARVRLALRSLAPADEAGTVHPEALHQALKVTLAAADAARTDTSLTDTVAANPGLAAMHARPAAVAAMLFRQEHSSWRGRLHMQAAALVALEDPKSPDAQQHLEYANVWLRNWSRSPDGDRGQFDADDIAYMALATALIDGVEQAVRVVVGWRPTSFVHKITNAVLARAPRWLPLATTRAALATSRASTWVSARTAVSYAEAGDSVPQQWVKSIAQRLDRLPHRPSAKPPTWGVAFCELALSSGVSNARTRRLLSRFASGVPDHFDEVDAHQLLRPVLSATSFRAALSGNTATADDALRLLPKLADDAPREQRERRERQRGLLSAAAGTLLSVLSARASCLASMRTDSSTTAITAVTQVADTVLSTLENIHSKPTRRSNFHSSERTWFIAATDAVASALHLLDRSRADDASGLGLDESHQQAAGTLANLLTNIADTAETSLGEGACWVWIAMARSLITKNLESDTAVDLLYRYAASIEAAAMPARERRDALLDAANEAQRIDREVASNLFDRAVVAAAGVDSDIDLRLRTIIDIAERAAQPAVDEERRRELAAMLTGAVEDATPFVDDAAEHLPHAEALRVAAQLHASTGLASTCRWIHEDRLDLTSGLVAALPAAINSRTMSAERAFWLLRLCPSYSHNRNIPELTTYILEAARTVRISGNNLASLQLATLTEWALRDTPLLYRLGSCRWIITAAESMQLGQLACINKLRDAAERLEELRESDEHRPSRLRSGSFTDREPSQNELTLRRLSADAGTATFINLEADLAQLREVWAGSELIQRYMTVALRSVPRADRQQALEALVGMTDRDLPGAKATDVAEAVRAMLHEFRDTNSIRTWAAQRMPQWVRDHLPSLFTYGNARDGRSVRQLVLPTLDMSLQMMHAIIQATATHLDALDATNLHAITRVLAAELTDGTACADTAWWALHNGPTHTMPATALARLEDFRRRRSELPTPPREPVDLLAGMMWSLLGHEDLHVRWRVVHTVRLLLEHGSTTALATTLWTLATSAEEDTGESSDHSRAFQAVETEFFWRSARTWLLIALARVAHSKPSVLLPISTALCDHALDRTAPHAATRELARDAALAIATEFPESLPAAVVERLRVANRPRSSTSTDDDRSHTGVDHVETRFYFSSFDTVPYWFRPLAEVFHGTTTQHVADLTDRWITDRWGRTDDERRNDHIRGRYGRSRRETHNDHGMIPQIETLETYLTVHAMLLAAGELVDSDAALSRPLYYETSDPWMDWLGRFLPGDFALWQSDLRQPAPITPLATGAWHHLQDEPALPTDDSTSASTGIDPVAVVKQAAASLRKLADDPSMIIVSASVQSDHGKHNCSAWADSALVSPDGAPSLLTALATSKYVMALPELDDDFGPRGGQIDVPGLRLLAWQTRHRHGREGLESHDPYAGAGASESRVPFSGFLIHAGLVGDHTKTVFTTPQGHVGARLVHWSDADSRDRSDTSGSRGWFLAVHRGLFVDYLRANGLSIVHTFRARLYLDNDSPIGSEDHDERIHDASCYLVMHADGTEVKIDGQPQQ